MTRSFAEILELEGHAEDGFMDALRLVLPLTAVDIDPELIYRTREARDADTPRLEVKVDIGPPAIEHEKIFNNQIYQCYDNYTGELEVLVVTNRTTDQARPTPTHRQMLGLVRAKLQKAIVITAGNWNNPVVIVKDIREQGTVESYEDEKNCDYSKLSWWFMIQVKPDVWPANPV